jgi:hypothetical protein
MAISRYKNSPRIALGTQHGTSSVVSLIRLGIKRGTIPIVRQVVVTGNDRLDTLAGSIYGDGRYWWVLAAASDVGWGLQVPPDTVINVIDLESLSRVMG